MNRINAHPERFFENTRDRSRLRLGSDDVARVGGHDPRDDEALRSSIEHADGKMQVQDVLDEERPARSRR
jgi:hypothetical protein